MSETLPRETAAHVAKLARLELSDAELDTYAAQLSAVLEHARDIAALDISDVPPTAHPLPLVNVFREDEPGELLDRKEVLDQAPDTDGQYFRVPRIIGEAP